MRWMKLEPIYYRVKWVRKRKINIIFYCTYTEPRKMVLKNLQGSSGETENGLMDMGRGEERVRCTERVTWKFALLCIK